MKLLTTAGLAAALFTATALGQTAKPSPYQGVSHPPADDAIVTNDLATPAPAPPVVPKAQPVAALEPQIPQTAPATLNGPRLVSRPTVPDAYSDADIVTSVPSGPHQLPEGTTLRVSLNQELSTATTQPGAEFTARLVQPVMKNDIIVIPTGATVVGRITSVSEGHRFRGPASIRLRPDEVDLPNGTRYFLHAEVYDIDKQTGTQPGSEGSVVSQDHKVRTLSEAGLFAGGGAAAGALLAGGPAAVLIGAAAGAGYVGAHWLLKSHEAVLPKNSQVVFGLTEPMSLVPFHE